jgi:putative hydrolase of the HAD superfamily
MHAADVGASKPTLLPFMSLSQRLGIPPSRILYVGDSYDNDVVGAKRAGMSAALLTRDAKEGVVFSSVIPDVVLASLDLLEFTKCIKR